FPCRAQAREGLTQCIITDSAPFAITPCEQGAGDLSSLLGGQGRRDKGRRARRRTPDAEGAVPATGSQASAVGAEGNAENAPPSVWQRQHLLPRSHVPDLDFPRHLVLSPVENAGPSRQALAVRAKGDVKGTTAEPLEVEDFLPRGHVPDFHLPVPTPGLVV